MACIRFKWLSLACVCMRLLALVCGACRCSRMLAWQWLERGGLLWLTVACVGARRWWSVASERGGGRRRGSKAVVVGVGASRRSVPWERGVGGSVVGCLLWFAVACRCSWWLAVACCGLLWLVVACVGARRWSVASERGGSQWRVWKRSVAWGRAGGRWRWSEALDGGFVARRFSVAWES